MINSILFLREFVLSLKTVYPLLGKNSVSYCCSLWMGWPDSMYMEKLVFSVSYYQNVNKKSCLLTTFVGAALASVMKLTTEMPVSGWRCAELEASYHLHP